MQKAGVETRAGLREGGRGGREGGRGDRKDGEVSAIHKSELQHLSFLPPSLPPSLPVAGRSSPRPLPEWVGQKRKCAVAHAAAPRDPFLAVWLEKGGREGGREGGRKGGREGGRVG